ncbi:hypothetical protein GUITHDRAFT_99300 [Guillardia theta CCMP2712]|uniref:Uncharacterized protein n=1 Tax=Guillardia theta (strain CCMP2712) TaxID=905079 RepID=L1K577_GUITC|nr:hypothetical protein GUITHDRAFT_99300 [Guillardia theta CCMP2712]EKX55523.1 hypothetical protein GUITHDRAFT_99300 [Guillardia theta CCMP2712]|eukprot:XP_005842503.1 hypothetical protein GUITHDRAFT_99300 [Guillardia theta CCMP2712]
MGNKSSKQQRLENAAKTGIFNLTTWKEKTLTSFPESALDVWILAGGMSLTFFEDPKPACVAHRTMWNHKFAV